MSEGKLMKKRIVIVGAGYAGVMTARKLANQFNQKSEYEIVLIDEHPFFTYRTSLHEVATKRIEPNAVQFDLRQLFMHQKNVKIVTARVENIDANQHIIHTSIGQVDYNKLIWAGGVEARSDVPGVNEYGFPFWSLDQATSLRVHIEEVIRQGAIELDEDIRQQKLRLVVVGGGYLGVQILGELLDERRILAKANQLRNREIELTLVESKAEILSDLDDARVSHKVENYLRHQGVKVYKKKAVSEIFEDHLVLNDGDNIMTNTVIWAGGTQGRTQMTELDLSQDEERHLQVTPEMRIQDQADIYALGDSVIQPLPAHLKERKGSETLMPKRGEHRYFWPQNVHNAVNQSGKLANNIAVKLLNHGDLSAFKPKSQRIFISVGSRYGVAIFKNRLAVTGFWAREFKHLSNLHFLAQLGSTYQIHQYLKREIFSTPQHMISGQGNVSNVGNTLWSLPLRLATGIFLIITGVAIGGGIGSIFAGVGMALFFGFMTTIAGFMTFLLSLVMLGTSFSISALLLPFVGIALMNGAGRSFGVDYWLVPFIQKNLGIFITGDSQASYNDLEDEKR